MTENNLGKLFARIAKVSGELGKLKKDATHAQGYAYFSADSIMGHINSLMAENGLAVIPTVLDCTVVDGSDKIQRWLITYEFAIGDIDGNVFSSRWTGEAPMQGKKQDGTLYADDKSMGKAHTYAYKYWLQKLFMISTVDSDDLDTNVTDSASQKPAQSQQKQGNQSKAQKPAQDKKSTNPDDHFGKKDNSASKTENWRDTLVILTKPLYTNEHHQKNGLNAALQNKLIGANVPMNDMLAAIFFHRCAKNWGMSIPEVVKVLGFNPLQMELTQEAVRQAWHHMKSAMSQMPE